MTPLNFTLYLMVYFAVLSSKRLNISETRLQDLPEEEIQELCIIHVQIDFLFYPRN